jgi:hypothetical protein
MPPPATVDPIAASELRPGLAADEEVVEVEPPLTCSSGQFAWKPNLYFAAGDRDSVAVCWPNFIFENLFEFGGHVLAQTLNSGTYSNFYAFVWVFN